MRVVPEHLMGRVQSAVMPLALAGVMLVTLAGALLSPAFRASNAAEMAAASVTRNGLSPIVRQSPASPLLCSETTRVPNAPGPCPQMRSSR